MILLRDGHNPRLNFVGPNAGHIRSEPEIHGNDWSYWRYLYGHRCAPEGFARAEKNVPRRCRKAYGSASLLHLAGGKRTHSSIRRYFGEDGPCVGNSDVPAFHRWCPYKQAKYT